jgi:hypothetical protein
MVGHVSRPHIRASALGRAAILGYTDFLGALVIGVAHVLFAKA